MKKRLLALYNSLFEKHGPQNWWPAETEYEVVVGALLTQNTNWKNVEKALDNLKRECLLSPKKIISADMDRLRRLIRPAGFYNQKSVRLKELTRKYLEVRRKKLRTEKLRNEFLSVKGVGPETADSILLYAFNKPVFVIDTYTRRFCSYYGLFKGKTYGEYQDLFMNNLPKNAKLFNEYHALIVKWGKEVKVLESGKI